MYSRLLSQAPARRISSASISQVAATASTRYLPRGGGGVSGRPFRLLAFSLCSFWRNLA